MIFVHSVDRGLQPTWMDTVDPLPVDGTMHD